MTTGVERKSKSIPQIPIGTKLQRNAPKRRTLSSDQILEIHTQIQALKEAARTEGKPSELRFRIMIGARKLEHLIDCK